MALFRGRIDLLEAELARDPDLLSRRFGFGEIYLPELGCSQDQVTMTHGAPLDGATLLHLAIDYDEMEVARWLIAQGADVNATASVDADGFGGHTPLFATVISQPNVAMNMGYAPMAAPSRSFCSPAGPIRTRALRCASSCIRAMGRTPCTNTAT